MGIFGFFIMLLSGVSTILIGITISSTADAMLFMSSLSLVLSGFFIWRKREFSLLTKIVTVVICLLFFWLFLVGLPTDDERRGDLGSDKGDVATVDSSTIESNQLDVQNATHINEQSQRGKDVPEGTIYIGNKKSKLYHTLDCEGGYDIKSKNKLYIYGIEEITAFGLSPASDCH